MRPAQGLFILLSFAAIVPSIEAQALSTKQPQPTSVVGPATLAHVKLIESATVEIVASKVDGSRNANNAAPQPAAITTPRAIGGLFVADPAQPLPAFKVGPSEVYRPSSRAWAILTIAQHSAATYDAWSTRHVLAQGGRSEADPLMQPFAHSPALYGAIQVGPGVLDFLGRRMSRSQNKWIHRLWWVPQAAATAGFLFSGSHNLANSR